MKIEVAPNGQTAKVSFGRLRFELWSHGGVTRIVSDNSLCGFHGTHYSRVTPGPWKDMAVAARNLWKNPAVIWLECE